ncbi:hypothetical protein B0H19DRAFT_1271442 [Mycena capillaripes]|nr:hypothetical protein B0H19DRAFT_1271442 [Mycena capillaripes]
MSPITLLPLEILGPIFTLGLPEQTVRWPAVPVIDRQGRRMGSEPRILAGPWTFGQVCSEWRTLAVSLPTLWTFITVSTTCVLRELPLLQTQLARSGNAPLDLLIRFSPGPYQDEVFDVFVPALVAHSPPRHRQPLPTIRCFRQSGLRNTIYVGATSFEREIPPATLVFRLSPTFRCRAQLVSYRATYDAATHLRNLAVTVNIVECDLRFVPGALADSLPLRDITLPHLLYLSHPAFLDRLTAPLLQTIYVGGVAETILPFLRRSGCIASLTALTLAHCPTPAHETITLPRHARSLTTLRLDLRYAGAAAELVAALAGALCPAHGSLAWVDPKDALDRAAFADMVVSRCSGSNGVRVLREVAVYTGRRRMKSAGWRLRAVPGLEMLFLTANKGVPAARQWRAY